MKVLRMFKKNDDQRAIVVKDHAIHFVEMTLYPEPTVVKRDIHPLPANIVVNGEIKDDIEFDFHLDEVVSKWNLKKGTV
ncbi:MAG: hypothetical protein ACRC5C_03005, partial [Bacilli bacterium]